MIALLSFSFEQATAILEEEVDISQVRAIASLDIFFIIFCFFFLIEYIIKGLFLANMAQILLCLWPVLLSLCPSVRDECNHTAAAAAHSPTDTVPEWP